MATENVVLSNILLCVVFHKKYNHSLDWNDMRDSKLQTKMQFWLNYPFKTKKYVCMEHNGFPHLLTTHVVEDKLNNNLIKNM